MGADDLISSGHLLLLYYFEQSKSILAMNTYPRLTISGSKYNTPNGCDKAPKGMQYSPKGRHHSGFLSEITVLFPDLFLERVELTGGNVSVVLVKLRKRIGVACKAVVFLYNVCPAL